MAGGAETPNIAALPAIARLGTCESARGPDADRHVKLLIQFAVEGSLSGAYSQSAVTPLQRPRAMGMFSSLTGLAVLSGPFIGGLLVDSLGWRSVFWVNVPFCVATAFLATLKIQSNDRVMSKVDLPGVVLLIIAMTAIVWGLSEGNAIGWSSAPIASALAIGTASAIAFFVWETKALDALVPRRLMQSIPFRAGNLACLLMFMSMMGTLIFMPQYFAITQQTSASGAGGRMTPWTVSLFVVAPISGILTSSLGERLPAVTGLPLQSAALMWMSFLCKSASGYGAWVPPLILAGVGISLAMPAVQSAVLGSVAPRDMGKASGIYNTMRQLGWACGAAAAIAIFTASGSLAAAETVSNGYAAVLQLTAVLSAMGALVSLKLPSAVQANVRAAAPAVSSPE